MNEDYVNYELAVKLKACGFNEPCEYYYTSKGRRVLNKLCVNNHFLDEIGNEACSAVPLWQAQKWLREKKGIAINVIAHDASDKYREGKYHWMEVHLPNSNENGPQWMDWFVYGKHPLFDTYEEALSDGLSQMLELIKKGE